VQSNGCSPIQTAFETIEVKSDNQPMTTCDGDGDRSPCSSVSSASFEAMYNTALERVNVKGGSGGEDPQYNHRIWDFLAREVDTHPDLVVLDPGDMDDAEFDDEESPESVPTMVSNFKIYKLQ